MWVAWAAKQDGIAPMAPWITLGLHIDGELDRDKALKIDCCHIKGCLELWICGPKSGACNVDQYKGLSPGMSIEVMFALTNGIKIRDQRQYIEQVFNNLYG